MLIIRIACRNVLRQKRRSLLTALMMVGGFVLTSLSLGITHGSYSHLINLFTRSHTGHVQIHRQGYLERPSLYNALTNLEELDKVIMAHQEVMVWGPRVYAPALAAAAEKTTGVEVIGVQLDREVQLTQLNKRVRQGRFLQLGMQNEVLLGQGVALILGVGLGDEIVLIGQGADGSIANDLFTIVGIVGQEGDLRSRVKCYVALEVAQEFLALPIGVHEIAIVLNEQQQAVELAKKLASILVNDGLAVTPWQEIEKEFFAAMQADIKGLWLSLGIIILIVGIGVLNTVLMTILERTREFGVLRALGTRPHHMMGMIILETIWLTLISLVPAVLLSLLGNFYLSLYGIPLPNAIEFSGVSVSTIRSSIAPHTVWIPVLVVLVTALLASVVPAWYATQITPVKALRAN